MDKRLEKLKNKAKPKNYNIFNWISTGIVGYANLSQRIVEEFSKMTSNEELNMSGIVDQYAQLEDAFKEKLENKLGYFIEAKYLFYSISKSENKVDLLKKSWQAFQQNNLLLSNIFNWQLELLEKYLEQGQEEEILKYIIYVEMNLGKKVNDQRKTFIEWSKEELETILLDDESSIKIEAKYEDNINKLIAELLNLDEHPDNFTIYDGALGKGEAMLELKALLPDKEIKFYGQELEANFVEAAKLNYLVHGIHPNDFKFISGDTLTDEKFSGALKFDNVVMDMPFIRGWDVNLIKEDDAFYQIVSALPSRTKPDYAFVLRGLLHLKDSGTMVAVVPRGALLRGSTEAKIRKRLIELNYLDAVINWTTESDVSKAEKSILVFKKNRTDKNVMFINVVDNGDNTGMKKVIDIYKKREKIPQLASVVSPEIIAKNDYNLYYSRYIDMFKAKPLLDLQEQKNKVKALQDKSQQNSQELANLLQDLTKDIDINADQVIEMLLK
ncbi:Type I restriction-modification system modification subunit [Ligilactobacillus hayakitensis DSM 18933 = JCM 14209]|uniref:site-specific DNA-methyltransferase (adenine-specific) n=1 Tax=Ligilactobacillus hayakitensis DSM 18933 = JCM 14209 TaxID=1423755 RepID=A0A0R1WUD3_9LACO|nr:N-6 DNA methylase [Ligilactobacillus hayakitensis]KRM19305.1 Type I restriction-modification system modification subunit [Ligilactobacillus hayakitensis DSM 18933 = JCM 14209]